MCVYVQSTTKEALLAFFLRVLPLCRVEMVSIDGLDRDLVQEVVPFSSSLALFVLVDLGALIDGWAC